MPNKRGHRPMLYSEKHNIDSSEKSINFQNREASQARNMYFSCRAPVYRIQNSDNVLCCVNPRQLHGKRSANYVWNNAAETN